VLERVTDATKEWRHAAVDAHRGGAAASLRVPSAARVRGDVTSSRRRRAAHGPGRDGLGELSNASLTVWHYTSAMGAGAGEVRLRTMEEQGVVSVIDAVVLVWMPGTPQPRVGRLRSRTGAGARRGAVLGALAGALVLAPVGDAAAGSSTRALANRLRQTGVDELFLHEVTSRLHPGSSALLVLAEDVDIDAVRPFLERGRSRGDVTLMHAVLRKDAPNAFRELLDELPATPPSPPESGDASVPGPRLASPPDATSAPPRRRKEMP